jgi:hypothetical protein
VWRVLAGDDGDGVPVLWGEATEHVQHLRHLAHQLADVAQCVGEALEVAGVHHDVHVTLNQVTELGLKVNNSVKLVVPELVVDRVPDGYAIALGPRTIAQTSLDTEL